MDIRDQQGFKAFLKCLREAHEFRMKPRGIAGLQNKEEDKIAEKVTRLLELSDEEIVEKFGERTSPEFMEKVWPYFDYLRQVNRVEERIYAQIRGFSNQELKLEAREMARAEIRNQNAKTKIGKGIQRMGQVLSLQSKVQRGEERRRTELIFTDLSELKKRLNKSEQIRLSLVIPEEVCRNFDDNLQKAVLEAQAYTQNKAKVQEEALAEATFYRSLGAFPLGSFFSIPPPWVAKADIELSRGVKPPKVVEGEVCVSAYSEVSYYRLRQAPQEEKSGLQHYLQQEADPQYTETRVPSQQQPER